MHGLPEMVLAMALIFALVIVMGGLLVRHRQQELRHKERLLAMEKGIALPAEPAGRPPAPWTPRVYLLRGLMWLFTGIALALMFLCFSIASHRPPSWETRNSTAQQLRREGASESDVQQYMREAAGENQGLPLGLAALGLVPAGVGLAYLIFYRTEGRRQDAA